jgi:thiosulfate/3-mercaptopyruvate sulfurtransferase
MNLKINLILLVCICLLSCNSNEKNSTIKIVQDSVEEERKSYVNTEHIIEVDELKILVGAKNMKVVHFGKPAQYAEGHIPGSVNIWRSDIESSTYPYDGMICSKKQVETLFSRLGISNGDTLLVYDAIASCDAARLWWVLKNYGYDRIRIVNGGIQEWKEKGGALTSEETVVEASNFILPTESPMSSYVTKEEMLRAVSSNEPLIIIDTRTQDEYSGKRQKKGAMSGGRIPKSHLIDWATCVNYNGDKKFKSYQELSKIYSNLIPNKDDNVIAYCHSGVRSAHTTFVLTELLGYKNVKNYDGSWTEWTHFESYPKELDSITTILQ